MALINSEPIFYAKKRRRNMAIYNRIYSKEKWDLVCKYNMEHGKR